MHTNPPTEDIRRILTDAKTIAMVGASSKPNRPSHSNMRWLLDAGYKVIPVNPREQEVLGHKAYASLSEIPEPVDIVNVFRRAEETPAIAEEAVNIGAKALWLQLGIASEEAYRTAKAGGLDVVMDMCIGVTHGRLGIPVKR